MTNKLFLLVLYIVMKHTYFKILVMAVYIYQSARIDVMIGNQACDVYHPVLNMTHKITS